MLIALPTFQHSVITGNGAFEALLFQKIAWTPNIPQQRNRSDWAPGRAQTIGLPGSETWSAKAFALPPADINEMWGWDAFLAACRGSENWFYLPALPMILQTSAANPTVTAAVAGNRAVTVSSVANVRVGMFATVLLNDAHPRMVKITEISGLVVKFNMTLTDNPAIGGDFVIDAPFAPMQLPNPNQPMTIIGEAFQFDAEEKL